MTIESSSFYIDQKIKVEPASNEIHIGRKSIVLQPRIMRLLQLLCDRPGEVIAKEELITKLWGHGSIYEESLTKAISILRQNLGDKLLIKTVPKIGYSFTGLVSVVENQDKPNRVPAYYALVLVVCLLAGFILVGNNNSTKERYISDYSQQYVTTDKALYINPTISESGELIAYVRRDQSGMPFNMVVKNLVTDQIVYQSDNAQASYDSPTISPDNKFVGFVNSYCKKKTLTTLDLKAGKSKDLYDLNQKSRFLALDWSADNEIVFSDWNDGTNSHDLFLLRTSDQNVQNITSSKFNEFEPEFSPNASSIVYIRENNGQYELCIKNLNQNKITVLLNSDKAIFDVTWKSPDRLLISKKGTVGVEVFQLDIETMEKEVLSNADFACVSSARDSDTFVASNYRRNDNVWMKSLEPYEQLAPKQILYSNRKEHKGAISPDNQSVAYVTDLSTIPQIWTYNFLDGNSKQLTHFEESHQLEKINWSPDADQLAVKFSSSHSSGVFLIDRTTSQTEIILADQSVKHPQFSIDRANLYFVNEITGELLSYHLNTGDVSKHASISIDGISYYQFNALENKFYYSNQEDRQIKVYDLNSGITEVLISKVDSRDLDSWALGSSGVYFIKRGRTNGNITFYDFTTKSETSIQQLPHNNYCYDTKLSVSQNDEFIIYNTISHFESDVVLVRRGS